VEALALDGKMDDGVASTGSILALANTTAGLSTPQTYTAVGDAAGTVAGSCVNTTTNVYATASQAASAAVACSISIRASY